MITLQKLKWDNCFSYGSGNELELNKATLTQILGSNGMGKSSIPLIIEEALFNKNSKGIKKADIPNRNINDGYYIHLTFTKDDAVYEIEVTRKASVKVKLLMNGEDISSHTATNTYKTIQELIGADFKTFSQLVYQNMNSSLQFLTATDTNRKKFLIDLLHLENYVELFDVFKVAAKEASLETARINSQIETVEKWLSENKLTDTTVLPMIELEIDTEDDEKELRHLTIEMENISEKNKKIEKNNKFKELLKRVDLTAVKEINVDSVESYDTFQSELGQKEATLSGSQRLLTKLEKLGDHCPTCEQPVDSDFKQSLIDQERKKIEESQVAMGKLKSDIKRIQENNRLFQLKRKTEREWEELYRSIDNDLPTTFLDRDSLDERLGGVRAKLVRAKKSLEEAARENEKRTRQNTKIQVIQEQTDGFIAQLKESSERLQEVQEVASNLEVLKKAFSTNGLLAYKIENLVEELEELVNQYLAELSDGKFTLEFVVTNDRLNVQITDNEIIVDISALSSGELAKVNTATLLAIRKLMSSISKSRINILFLDEVIAVLDSAGREKLVEILLAEELNTYIVSHEWQHPLLEKLEVTKVEGISCIE